MTRLEAEPFRPTRSRRSEEGCSAEGSRLGRSDFPGTKGVTLGYGIDNSGDLVGVYTDTAGVSHRYLRTRDGSFRAPRDAPGAGMAAGQGTFPTELTEREIVGFCIDPSRTYHGYRESLTGTFSVIDAPGADTGPGQGTLIYAFNPARELSGGFVTPNNGEFGLVEGEVIAYNDQDTPPQNPTGGTEVIGARVCGVATGDFADANTSTRPYLDLGGAEHGCIATVCTAGANGG